MPRMIAKPSLFPSATGYLVLRVNGTERDGQLVRLQSPKCTIGSGPNCTLRLRADSVDPAHCLVLRGPERTIVRRWSADTRLNGRAFNESEIQAGDRLSIGRLELDVVETGQAETPAEARLAKQRLLDEQLVEIEARLRSLDEQDAECLARKAECETREADLAALRAEWDTRQADEREQYEVREAELESIRAELEASRGDLEASRSELQEERRQWDASHTEWTAHRAAEAEQSAARSAEFDAARQALDEHRTAWQAELEAAQGAIDEQTAAWQAETTELEQREANARAELDRMKADVEEAQTALAEERRQWETRRADASDVQSSAAGLIAARQAELEAAQRLIDEQSAAMRAETAEHLRRDADVRADLERAGRSRFDASGAGRRAAAMGIAPGGRSHDALSDRRATRGEASRA